MNRRELIRNSLITMGVLAVGPHASARIFEAGENAFVELERADWKPAFFNAQQNEAVIALSETIIPATDTPGAKDALVNRFLDLVLAAEPASTQKEFLDSVAWFDGGARERYKKSFADLSAQEKEDFLNLVAFPHSHPRWGVREKTFPGNEHFMVVKQWVAAAFYSSPIGLQEQGWDGWAARGTFAGCEHEPGAHPPAEHQPSAPDGQHNTGDHAE